MRLAAFCARTRRPGSAPLDDVARRRQGARLMLILSHGLLPYRNRL
jgi:hypothetical protein